MSRRIVKRTIKGCLVLAIAVASAEGFLRVTTPRELVYDTWFTPGVHQPDEKFGFVFTPHYRGEMRHRDKVWNVPLELDENGFRRPSISNQSPKTRKVAIVGGASMMMCYGLPDDCTIAHRVADASAEPLDVRAVAWPGFDVLRSWHIYLDKLERSEPPELVVLCIYAKSLADFAALPADVSLPPVPHGGAKRLRFRNGIVVPPRGRLAERFCTAYEGSFLLCKTIALADRCWDKINPTESPASNFSDSDVVAEDPAEIGGTRFVSFLEHVRNHLSSRGIELSVAFLPIQKMPAEFYEPLVAAIPASISYVDLHRELVSELDPQDYIADGHYGPTQSQQIGVSLAEEVDEQLIIKDMLAIGKERVYSYHDRTRSRQQR